MIQTDEQSSIAVWKATHLINEAAAATKFLPQPGDQLPVFPTLLQGIQLLNNLRVLLLLDHLLDPDGRLQLAKGMDLFHQIHVPVLELVQLATLPLTFL
jgi:hypothetical protein